MPDRIFRFLASAPTLTEEERREVVCEVGRLRGLVAGLPGEARVRIRANPSGPLGDYVALLLDAQERGVPEQVVLPTAVRQQYGQRRWFITSLRVLDAFTGQPHRYC